MNDAMLNNYAGFLVDSHITEDDESLLSRLEPASFVSMVQKSGADSIMVYAACHNGNMHYPTRVGHMHKALGGRDHFGQVVALLRKNGILPRAYCTVVYQRRYARANPDWRVCQVDGAQNYRRSWYCCPNSRSYRDWAKQHIAEICAYDIESIFIDMTFWPGICVCHNCRTRWLQESGGREIPQKIDWNDPQWVQFQRARARWLAEFARELTAAARAVKPQIVVAHQFSPVLLGWLYAQSPELADAQDVPSGDFYGGKHQQRMGCKVLAAFEKGPLPFEYMTSRCVTLYDHTSTKSDDEMASAYATTMANGGTHLLIDAINPDGSLEPRFYDRVGRIAETMRPFKQKLAELRPRPVADIGVYWSMKSHVRRDHNGTSLRDLMDPANNMLAITDIGPIQEVLGTSIVLNRCHAPYRMVTERATDLGGLKAIIVNDASFMSPAECDRLRQFVHDGGTLIATGMTSYYDDAGHTTGDFALGDVLGVRFSGRFSRRWNYLVPPEGELVSCDQPSPLVDTTTATVLARVSEPLFDPDDLEHFASYHSSPPGPTGPHAALTANRFGQGTCVYLYSSIFAKQQEAQQAFGESLLRRFAPSSIVRATNAPKSVEITLLRGTRAGGYLLCLVNYQDELPSIPIHDLEVTISLPCGGGGGAAATCRSVAGNRIVEPERNADRLTFRIPRLDIIEMIHIEMKEHKP